MSAPAKPRCLTLRILRSAPGTHVEPEWQDFAIEEGEGMTLFIALNEIRQNLDPSLQFDFVCRAGICGSCGMLIDGQPGVPCTTFVRELGKRISVAPGHHAQGWDGLRNIVRGGH